MSGGLLYGVWSIPTYPLPGYQEYQSVVGGHTHYQESYGLHVRSRDPLVAYYICYMLYKCSRRRHIYKPDLPVRAISCTLAKFHHCMLSALSTFIHHCSFMIISSAYMLISVIKCLLNNVLMQLLNFNLSPTAFIN